MPASRVLSAAERGFDLWRAAMRWQRAVDLALRPLDLTHTQYLILAATAKAIAEQNDAVSHAAIARAAGLDRATTSVLMRKLDDRRLVDRGNHGTDCRQWRVLITQRGQRLLEKATVLVERVAADAGANP